MSTAPHLKVLISGGGIAGHCLAYWLARTRLQTSITILERSASARVTGQAVDIHPPSLEITEKMGLLQRIRDYNTTEIGTTLRKPSGKEFLNVIQADGFSFTNEYEILRGDLAMLFNEASQKFGNIRCVYGDSVKSLTQTDREVHVTYNSGSEDTFDLVIGADGASSRTRGMILDQKITEGSYKFLGQYLAWFSIPRVPEDNKMWQWVNLPKGRCVMIRPHRNPNTVGCYLAVTMSGHGVKDEAMEAAISKGDKFTKDLFRKHFEKDGYQAERVLAGMDTADDYYVSRTAQVKLSKWTNGRAAVIGDAAWATFGVGTTLAVTGPYYLAGEIGKIKSTAEIPEALARYERNFRPLFSTMEDLPPFYPQFLFPQTTKGLRIRDSALWLVSKGLKAFGRSGGGEKKIPLPEYDWVDA